MKKYIPLLILEILISQMNVGHALQENVFYLYNPDDTYIRIYTTEAECLSEAESRSFLLNGFSIDANYVSQGNGCVKITILDKNFFCKSAYAVKFLPSQHFHGFLRPIKEDAPFFAIDHNEIIKGIITASAEVSIWGMIDGYYYVLFENNQGFIDLGYIDSYMYEDAPFPGMASSTEIEQIAKNIIEKEYFVSTIDTYHISIGLLTCAKNPEASLYVVNIYYDEPDKNVYVVYIDPVTKNVLYTHYAEIILG